MTPTMIATLGTHARAAGRLLVGGGQLAAPATLLRAQVSTRATAPGASGSWTEFLADAPRFPGSPAALLVEGQRSNGIRNPRAEGAMPGTIGAGGAMPGFWTLSTSLGIAAEVLAAGSVDGVSVLRLRLHGTASASGEQSLQAEQNLAIAAENGQGWTHSVFLSRAVNAGTAMNVQMRAITRNGAGAQLSAFAGTNETVGTALARASRSFTIADATAAAIQPLLTFPVTNGVTYDSTFEIGWPQLELGAFASTPILPAAGAPGASTRGADLAGATAAALGIAGPCTLLFKGAATALAGLLTVMQIGSGGNRYYLRFNGTTLQLRRDTAGVAASVNLGAVAAGAAFRCGITVDGTGNALGVLDAGSVQGVAGGPAGTLSSVSIAATHDGAAALFGTCETFTVHPGAVDSATLAALVGAL